MSDSQFLLRNNCINKTSGHSGKILEEWALSSRTYRNVYLVVHELLVHELLVHEVHELLVTNYDFF